MKEEKTIDLKAGLTIKRDNLDEELEKQAAMYLFVAEKAAMAELELDSHKVTQGRMEAVLDADYRIKLEESKVKPTENMVKMMIERDEKYFTAAKTEIALKARLNLAKAMREAWYVRKDMLIQIAIRQRADMVAIMSDRVMSERAA